MTRSLDKKTYVKGAVLTLLGGVCWGLSGSMGQYLFDVQGMDSRWLVPLRLGLAGIILLVYSAVRFTPSVVVQPWKTKEDRRDLIVYGLLGVSLCQFLYFTTIQLSTAGAATILQDLSPVLILIWSCIVGRRAPRFTEILAIVMALLGVYLLTTHGDFAHPAISAAALATGVLSAVCVMIYNVVPGRLMSRYPVLLLQGWAFLMGSLCFTLVFRPWHFHYVPNAIGWFGVFFVVVVGNVMAFPFYMQGVKYIGPEKGILYGFAEPLTAAVIGVLLLGNSFTIWDLLGFAAVFAMLVLISAPGKK